MWATARPRRTIVILSTLCSTASSSSAKFRAALVALISVTLSDYQIIRYWYRRSGVNILRLANQ